MFSEYRIVEAVCEDSVLRGPSVFKYEAKLCPPCCYTRYVLPRRLILGTPKRWSLIAKPLLPFGICGIRYSWNSTSEKVTLCHYWQPPLRGAFECCVIDVFERTITREKMKITGDILTGFGTWDIQTDNPPTLKLFNLFHEWRSWKHPVGVCNTRLSGSPNV